MTKIIYRTSAICNSCGKSVDFTRPQWLRGEYPSQIETTPDGWMGEVQFTLIIGRILYAHICDECRILPFETVYNNMNERVVNDGSI